MFQPSKMFSLCRPLWPRLIGPLWPVQPSIAILEGLCMATWNSHITPTSTTNITTNMVVYHPPTGCQYLYITPALNSKQDVHSTHIHLAILWNWNYLLDKSILSRYWYFSNIASYQTTVNWAQLSKWTQRNDALLMHWWCTNDELMMRWWCTGDVLMMHWWYTDDTLIIHW